MRLAASVVTIGPVDVTEFVLSQLPAPPARILEVGCGSGELALAVAEAGYDVLAIDPAAPEGEIFRPLKLEELEEDELFDAVVANRVLHHVTDIEPALDRIRDHLRPGGLLVVQDFGWDRLDEPTAEWFYGQRRALAVARGTSAPASLDDCCGEWEAHHVGMHGYAKLRAELDERFEERLFAWTPYLHRYLEDAVAAKSLERTLIESDAIQAVGWRYVGRKPDRLPAA